ncbi:hypothetical protein [Sphingorhabdus sp.]|uniref:hypothetical protein n=1 Tax=Sphingorhabdus sp. TaxID=1902408 RepID=UPI00391CEFCE
MTNARSVKSFTKTALVAALLSGSCLAAAQEAPIVTSTPAPVPQAEVQPAPATTVAPPPLVRTLPTENDVVNPAAQQQAAEEANARATPAPVARSRVAAPVQARPIQPQGGSPAPATPSAESTIFNEPAISTALPPVENATSTVTSPQNAGSEAEAAPAVESADNDLPLFAGLAAALAALGLGGLFMARRRRVPEDERQTIGHKHIAHATVVPVTPTQAQVPIQTAVAPQERPRLRESVNSRPDIPVTDPLFSTPVVAGPITDPMFAPRNDVQTPITDPLFAKHKGFAGRLRDSRPNLTPETV